jgi:hypothetical protein
VKEWSELVGAALLGTERRPPPEGLPVLAVEAAAPEDALLGRAAVAALYRRAGARPSRDGARPPAPAPDETQPRCSPAAGARLRAILLDRHDRLLDEWLAVAARAGVRAPEELLPELLERGRSREALLAVGGGRIRWLAALNDRWRRLTAGERDEAWDEGPLDARVAWLRDRRRRDPAAARATLEESWKDEEPAARSALVAALADGLSRDDEPFLETVLDDRRKEVREAAQELLAGLPQSAFAARMAERARPLLRVSRGLRRRLEVELPGEPDAAARRDGISFRAGAGAGPRAAALTQILAAAPLDIWRESLGAAPAELAALPVADRLRKEVHAGWDLAAVRQRDAEWAEALLHHDPAAAVPGLLELLPVDRRQRLIRDCLSGSGPLTVVEVGRLLPLLPPWGRELSERIVERLNATVRDDAGRTLFRHFGLALHPSVVDEAEAALAGFPPGSAEARAGDELIAMLQFRHDLHRELA